MCGTESLRFKLLRKAPV